jgi:indole-3-acetate monooxygenase
VAKVEDVATALHPDLSGTLAVLRAEASLNEHNRCLTEATVDALRDVDAFRLFVPQQYDGPGLTVLDSLRTLTALSQADAAAGWCATVASQTSHMAGNLPSDWASKIFENRRSIANGAFAPLGEATKVAGGYQLSGRWGWGSGSAFANWISAGALTNDGEFLQLIVEASDAEIHDTWNPIGLRGTGSNDFSIHDVFVPAERSVAFGKAKPMVDDPIARTPGFVLFASGIACVLLGIAQRAVSEATELMQTKRPVQSRKTVSESPVSQVELARADTLVRSAREYLFAEVGVVVDQVQQGVGIGIDDRLRVRQAATYAAEQCVEAVDRCYRLGGGTSVDAATVLARCFRDVHTASAHIMISSRTYETVGRHLLGYPIDTNSL